MNLFLVACVKKKLTSPAPAREMYISQWFRSARLFVEATGDPWWILSAEHGLLSPDQYIIPYERSMSSHQWRRKRWARMVLRQMKYTLPEARSVTVLAGTDYRAYIMPYLNSRYPIVRVPMRGMMLGQQLSCLKKMVRASGIEPDWPGWKPGNQPMTQARIR